MNKKINTLIKQKEKILEKLENEILNEMECVAKREKIDVIVLSWYGNTYERNNIEVTSRKLDKLDDFYCDNVHSGGIQAVWYLNKGWC